MEEESDEKARGQILNSSLMNLIEVLEKACHAKEKEANVLKQGLNDRAKMLREKENETEEKIVRVKKMRVNCQQGIRDIERKLDALRIDPLDEIGPIPDI